MITNGKNMIPSEKILKQFIKAGKMIDEDKDTAIVNVEKLNKFDFINILGPEDCRIIAEKLKVDELGFFIKAIVEAERVNEWIGGSVASTIWLFSELQKLNITKSIDLANWILLRTKNIYVPFGFNNHNAKSYDEYIKINKKINEQIVRSINSQKIQEENAINERDKKKQQRKLLTTLRKTEERKRVIETLNQITAQEQINFIIQNDKYSIGFYPTSLIANYTNDFVKNLERELVIELLLKLKGRHKGPWGMFKRRLIEIHFKNEKLPWDREPWHSY